MDAFTIVGATRAQVGESPWWDRERNCLWWVDTFAPAVLQTSSAATHVYPTAELAGGVALGDDGRLAVAMESGLFVLDPAGFGLTFLSAPAGLPVTHRFNDLTVDPRGRLIVGTMKKSQLGPPEPTGELYSYDQGRWTQLRDGLTTVNGLAFSPAGDRIYWSDSFPAINQIWHAAYDARTGNVGETELFIDMRKHRGRPDGAAVDEQGGYWIAAIGGGCLHRFLPDGTRDLTLELPIEHPTKPAFTGVGLKTLHVTSLSVRPSSTKPELAGALVTAAAPVAGLAIPPVRLARMEEAEALT